MAIPLLLTAGRVLLMGGGRAAAGGAARGAIANTFKQKAIDTAKDKAVSIVKGKVKEKAKKISTKKLLAKTKNFGIGGGKGGRGGGGGGGALVLRKSSAIVKSSSGALAKTEDNKPGGALVKSTNIRDEILQELERIKIDVVKIKEISTQKLLNQKEESENDFIASRKKKAEEQEKSLEEKKDTKKKKKLGITAPKVGLFDMIKNFLLNVLIGSLLNYALKHGPTILKMFKEIGEGLTNTWNVLRLGIITLTTAFPRQVRMVARLTRAIIGPPARLIGKLLSKAGGVAANLFKKAGGVIFNLVKGPLTSLVKRVGSEALEKGARGAANLAGRVAGAAGNALKSNAAGAIVKRLKSFSASIKGIPFIGSLIGIGIDLALGETLGRAAAGAAGAALGAGVGKFLGTKAALATAIATGGLGILAAPIIIGASSFLGSAVGDWVGKQVYDKVAPKAEKDTTIEGKAYGGRVNVRGGGTRTLSRSTSVQSKPSGSSAISPQTLKKAEGTLLKDEESAKRFANLSSTYGAIPFIGEAMKLGLDISLGEKVTKPRTDAIAESIGSAIGIALKNDEFGVPGFNKRIVGQFSKNLTAWAKKKIFVDVKSQESQFGLAAKKKEEEQTKPGGTEGGTPSDGGDPLDAADLNAIKASSADKKAAAHLSTLEASSPQHVADVYQVILNRAAKQSGGIAAVITAREQFSPYSAAIFGTSADGAAARKYGGLKVTKKELFELAGKPDGIEQLTKRFNAGNPRVAAQVLADFESGGALSKSSKQFVGGAQYFMGYATKVAGERRRPDGGNYIRDNYGGGGVNGVKRHKVPFLAMGGNHQVTSDMGMRNFALSPGMHMGVDISGTRGEPLQAFTDGMVEATGYDGGYGNWINWIDNKGIGHFYGHMDKPAYVRGGQKIKKGTILGPLGNTGKSSGPHLHWEAATNPTDNGRPKSAVLSRFNPLSKYNKESPFGGSIQPDPSIASSASAPGAPGSPGASDIPTAPTEKPSASALKFAVIGDPAAAKGGRGGGGGIDLWGISPSRNAKLNSNSTFSDVPAHHRSYTTEAGIPRDYAVVKSGVNPVANPSAGRGENVVAGVSGKVSFAGYADGAGNMVEISSGGKKIIRLLHLDKILSRTGQSVNPTTVIGTQGNTGTKDIHVHVDGSSSVQTNWIKSMLGGQYTANPSTSDSGSSSGAPGAPGSPDIPSAPPEKPSETALKFAVIGDPSIKQSMPNINETPSYNKSNQTLILTQTPSAPAQMPVGGKSSGGGIPIGALDNVVNSYGMVSRHIITSSMYKI